MGPLLIPARCAIFTAGLDDVEQWKSGYWYGSLVEFLLTFHDAHFDSVLTVLTAVKVFVIVWTFEENFHLSLHFLKHSISPLS